MTRAPLSEVFASFQGEGPLVGVRQVFARLRGCDLDCIYCDTPAARESTGPCRVQERPGADSWTEAPSPMSAEEVVDHVGRLAGPAGLTHSVAVTGGEPLLHPEFIAELARGLHSLSLRVWLESAGHLPEVLARVLDHLDFVSLDFKLPSTLGRVIPGELFTQSAAIAGDKCVSVKMVVLQSTPELEVERAAQLLAGACVAAPLVIQPVSALSDPGQAPCEDKLHRLHDLARGHLCDVRVIPQCHRVMGVR